MDSIFSIIQSDNLDKMIFSFELKSEKISKTLDNAIFGVVLSQTSKKFKKTNFLVFFLNPDLDDIFEKIKLTYSWDRFDLTKQELNSQIEAIVNWVSIISYKLKN